VTRWARILELVDSLEDWAMEYTAGSELGTVRRQASELHELLADSLDAAWAEAEAALPGTDWHISLQYVPDFWALGRAGTPWVAHASEETPSRSATREWVYGPTRAAALRALAEGLREARP
jgi:hypothetical protein